MYKLSWAMDKMETLDGDTSNLGGDLKCRARTLGRDAIEGEEGGNGWIKRLEFQK